MPNGDFHLYSMNKKTAFLPQSVKKAAKAESIEEMACS